MENKSLLHNDEIDLVSLIKTIYNEKIKVIIITIISLFIGIGYNSQLSPSSHLHSLTIKTSDNSEFARLNSVTYYFQSIKNLNFNKSFGLKKENQKEYNQMIGLGGWGGRNEKSGPYLFYNDLGKLIRDPRPGRGGSHGPQSEFIVQVRDFKHSITKGMPQKWLHSKDELYDSLRGPAEKVKILATAYSEKSKKHEPMIMTISYGKGRVFHTPMGHADYSMKCIGFQEVLRRGTEWAATGQVTSELPLDFPTEKKVSSQ